MDETPKIGLVSEWIVTQTFEKTLGINTDKNQFLNFLSTVETIRQ